MIDDVYVVIVCSAVVLVIGFDLYLVLLRCSMIDKDSTVRRQQNAVYQLLGPLRNQDPYQLDLKLKLTSFSEASLGQLLLLSLSLSEENM